MEKEYSAGEIGEFSVKYFEAQGCVLRKINNVVVRRRKGTLKKGTPDYVGHTRVGVALYVEVKTIRDKLSADQIEFLLHAESCGCFCYIATQLKSGGRIEIIKFSEYYILKNIKPKE